MSKTILVTGANGLVGSALQRLAPSYPQYKWVWVTRDIVDLSWDDRAANYFYNLKFDYVIHLAGLIGGVNMHQNIPADVFEHNLRINLNVISGCQYVAEKLLAFSSICAYPDSFCPCPLTEDMMHDGEPSGFNRGYAYAKRMMDIHIETCRQQYGVENWCTVVPVNITGINDNYNLDNGHVIPCLLHRFYRAMYMGEPIQLYGDGSPLREFLDADNVAQMCIQLLGMDKLPPRLILSPGKEHSIKEIVSYLQIITGYTDKVYWDHGPNGQLRRPTDNNLMLSLGLKPDTDVYASLEKSWKWFCENYEKARK